jgi:hypothetical protein
MMVRGRYFRNTACKPGVPGKCWAYYKVANRESVAEHTMCVASARDGMLTCAAHDAWEKAARARKFDIEHFDPVKFAQMQKTRKRYERRIKSGAELPDNTSIHEALRRVLDLIEQERAKPEIPTAALRQREAEASRRKL